MADKYDFMVVMTLLVPSKKTLEQADPAPGCPVRSLMHESL